MKNSWAPGRSVSWTGFGAVGWGMVAMASAASAAAYQPAMWTCETSRAAAVLSNPWARPSSGRRPRISRPGRSRRSRSVCSCSIRVSRRIGARLADGVARAFRAGGAADAVPMPMTEAITAAMNATVTPPRRRADAARRRAGGESPLNRGELRMLLAGRNRLGPGPVAGLHDLFGQFLPAEPSPRRSLQRSVQPPPPLPARPSPLSQLRTTEPRSLGSDSRPEASKDGDSVGTDDLRERRPGRGGDELGRRCGAGRQRAGPENTSSRASAKIRWPATLGWLMLFSMSVR